MRPRAILAATSALALLAPAAAWAQEADAVDEQAAQADTGQPTPSSAPTGTTPTEAVDASEEIVVTARRREESLKDVPIAVSAVSGETIRQQQLYTVREVAQLTPGLNINSDSVGRAFVSIRGVGTTLIDTVQPGVGIFIDGIYQPNTSYLNSPLVDVERVEVLRGPQGTLFGNNTLGGAINVITRQPSNTPTARADATYAGPDDFRSASLAVGGPLVEDVLQVRVGAAYHHRDGFSDNLLAGGKVNPLTQHSVNGTIRFLPADGITFTLNGNIDRVKGGNTPYITVAGPRDERTIDGSRNQNSIAEIVFKGISLKADFEIDSLDTTLTAIGAYNKRDLEFSNDGDFSPVDFLRTAGENDLETITGELRADTRWSDRFSTLIGLFANRATTDASGTTRLVPLGLTVPNALEAENEAQAIYGTAFIDITDTLELGLGLRYDHQRLDASSASTAEVYEASELQPRVTLTNRFTPDFMAYASVARGFRGGGQNGPGAPNLIYEGDSVWTYELGTKFTVLDRRLSIDAAVFYNDYDNFIGQNALAPSTTGAGFVAVNLNTGTVRSYGAELEAHWRITDNWRIDGGLTLLNARITDDAPFQAITGFPVSSDRIIFTPDWNYNIGTTYVLPLGDNDIVANANLIGKGSRVGSSLDPDVEPVLKSFHLVNASVAYRFGGFEVAAFATNLLNERYIESYIDRSALVRAGLAALASNLAVPGDRRRIGARASFRF